MVFFFLLLEQLISVHVQVEENAGAFGRCEHLLFLYNSVVAQCKLHPGQKKTLYTANTTLAQSSAQTAC